MVAVGSAEVILFGIQAGLRLYGAARQSYVERTRERALTLPLPGLPHEREPKHARLWFEQSDGGKHNVSASPRLTELHGRAKADLTSFQRDRPEEAAEYVEAYLFLVSVESGRRLDGLLTTDVVALNTLAQWRRGEAPHPNALKRIGGTLVEIGIDYFATGPGRGRLSGSSPAKSMLRDLLEQLDDVQFSSEGLESVIEKVFVATLDSLASNPELVSGDPRAQELVVAVGRGLVSDVETRLAALDPADRLFAADRLGDLAGLVLRGVVRHGAQAVLQSPETFLSAEPGQHALISNVGTAILDTVLPADGGVELDALFSGESLERLARSTLRVVVEHPELLGVDDDDRGLRTLLTEVAGGLADSTRAFGPDLLPEAARLVLERTAANLDLLWKVDGAEKHLLVTATKTLLAEISAVPADGVAWKPALGKTQVLTVVESVLDEVVDQPGLISRSVGGQPALAAAVQAVLGELAAVELDQLDSASAATILQHGISAAAERWELLDRIPGGGADAKTALGHVVGALLQSAFPGAADAPTQRAAWALARGSVLEATAGAALELLAESGVGEEAIAAFDETLADSVDRLKQGGSFSVDRFATDLEARLAA